MEDKIWWKSLKPFRLAPNWKIVWNKLEDVEPDHTAPDDARWLFTFVQDMTRIVTEYTYKKNRQTKTHTLAIDLGWIPEGDVVGHYDLSAILDDDWENPVLTARTRSTQEIADIMESWMFEKLTDVFWMQVRQGEGDLHRGGKKMA